MTLKQSINQLISNPNLDLETLKKIDIYLDTFVFNKSCTEQEKQELSNFCDLFNKILSL